MAHIIAPTIRQLWWLHGLDPTTRPCSGCGAAITRDGNRSECKPCRSKRDRQRRKTACIECARPVPFSAHGICTACRTGQPA